VVAAGQVPEGQPVLIVVVVLVVVLVDTLKNTLYGLPR
jgi:hypothetical protein